MKTASTDKWKYRKRTESRPCHPEDVGWYALAAGIVQQAVEDYRAANKRIKSAQTIENPQARALAIYRAKARKDEVIRFFRSQWYGTLCDIDPERIIKKLKEESHECD